MPMKQWPMYKYKKRLILQVCPSSWSRRKTECHVLIYHAGYLFTPSLPIPETKLTTKAHRKSNLVGGFNPIETYSSKWTYSPKFGVKNHQLEIPTNFFGGHTPFDCMSPNQRLFSPSRELTYPNFGKGKSSS